MGLLGGLFGNKKEKKTQKQLPWIVLDCEEQLDEIKESSKDQLIAIFKHSTRCGTSRMALRNFEDGYHLEWDHVQIYILDLLNHRDISDRISEEFQVFHQSPQLILIKEGQVVDHTSHYQILAESLSAYA